MNCLRINIGIEHGNETFRREALDRPVTNKRMLDAFHACAGRNFVTVANSIIGFPEETRELIFDTIEFNRQLPREIEASGAFIFTPYHGTSLRDVAIRNGYLEPDSICSLNVTKGSILDMPQITSQELQGIARVFSFYVKMPKECFPKIRVSEGFDLIGEKTFLELREEFQARYRGSDVGPKENSSFDLVQDTKQWREGQSYSDLHG
jgi:radical SAM superfamily enzyme YgiQ (UPF0313 family)